MAGKVSEDDAVVVILLFFFCDLTGICWRMTRRVWKKISKNNSSRFVAAAPSIRVLVVCGKYYERFLGVRRLWADGGLLSVSHLYVDCVLLGMKVCDDVRYSCLVYWYALYVRGPNGNSGTSCLPVDAFMHSCIHALAVTLLCTPTTFDRYEKCFGRAIYRLGKPWAYLAGQRVTFCAGLKEKIALHKFAFKGFVSLRVKISFRLWKKKKWLLFDFWMSGADSVICGRSFWCLVCLFLNFSLYFLVFIFILFFFLLHEICFWLFQSFPKRTCWVFF